MGFQNLHTEHQNLNLKPQTPNPKLQTPNTKDQNTPQAENVNGRKGSRKRMSVEEMVDGR